MKWPDWGTLDEARAQRVRQARAVYAAQRIVMETWYAQRQLRLQKEQLIADATFIVQVARAETQLAALQDLRAILNQGAPGGS